jgi:hypothetical protein
MKTNPDAFDPTALELDGTDKRRSRPKPKVPKIDGPFVRGPIPARWLVIAKRQRGGNSALSLAIVLWQIAGITRTFSFTLSNVQLRYWEIGRKQKKCGLEYLEAAGLIRTEQVGKRSVEVTLLCTLGEEPQK